MTHLFILSIVVLYISQAFGTTLYRMPLQIRQLQIPVLDSGDGMGEGNSYNKTSRNEFNLGAKKRGTHESVVKMYHSASALVGSVNVGSQPNTEFYVLLDTGSDPLWLYGAGHDGIKKSLKEADPYDTFTHNYYDPKPKTHKAITSQDRDFGIGYVDGSSFRGIKGLDTVKFAGVELKGAAVIAVHEMVRLHDTGYMGFDGILGLGFQDPNREVEYDSPFVEIMHGKHFHNKVFAIHVSGNGLEGEIMFGGIDDKLYTGSLHYAPLVRGDFMEGEMQWWEVTVSSVHLGKTRLDKKNKKADVQTNRLLVDTGHYGSMCVPQDILAQILKTTNAKVKGHLTLMKCKDADKLPELKLLVHKHELVFSIKELTIPTTNKDECRLALKPAYADNPRWIVGIEFFKKYFTVFDYGKMQIGFAHSVVVEGHHHNGGKGHHHNGGHGHNGGHSNTDSDEFAYSDSSEIGGGGGGGGGGGFLSDSDSLDFSVSEDD